VQCAVTRTVSVARAPLATSAQLGQQQEFLTFPLLLAQMRQMGPPPPTFRGQQGGHRSERTRRGDHGRRRPGFAGYGKSPTLG
jgi:hypothetical protein